jgi:hypothetical protein
MLQRIQSVYLSVAFAALIAIYFFPIASFTSDFVYYKYYLTHMLKIADQSADVAATVNNNMILPLGIFNGLIALTVLVAVFLFKNRRFQSKIVKLGILMNVILVGLIFFVFAPLIGRTLGAAVDYSGDAGIYFTLISLLMLILANRGIIKDEKLVRAADRLR